MKTLGESILTSIGQGDRYFENIIKQLKLRPENITHNKDGSINYDGSVEIRHMNFKTIPITFSTVGTNFIIEDCPELISLKGCPKEIPHGFFYCRDCKKLTTLEGIPEKVGGSMYIMNCGRKFTKDEIRKLSEVRYLIKLK